jgi:hypothetical protein
MTWQSRRNPKGPTGSDVVENYFVSIAMRWGCAPL